MMIRILFLFMVLSGCGAQPALHMLGAERIEVSREGREYVVFKKGDRVEVIRLGWAKAGEHQAIRATMIALIPEVTGCKLRPATLWGDSGEIRGKISCPRKS